MSNLEKQFKTFLACLPESEDIDKIQLPKGKGGERKADFLLKNRRIILEYKTLSHESKGVNEYLDKKGYTTRPEFPLVYGQVPLKQAISSFSKDDQYKINDEVFHVTTRKIRNYFEDASSQISKTKEIFNLTNSWGLLVILNDTNTLLDPTIVTYSLSHKFNESDSNGIPSNIQAAIYISEKHSIHNQHTIMTIRGGEASKSSEMQANLLEIEKAWSYFNNESHFNMDIENKADFDKLNFKDR